MGIEELKEFILWCKFQKLSKVRLDKIWFEIHDTGVVEVIEQELRAEDQLDALAKKPETSMWDDPDMFLSSDK